MSIDYFNETISNKVKNNEFLPSYYISYGSSNFSGMDSEDLFNKNLKTQPSDWYYRTALVRYTTNKHGYRTKEFDDIDWANGIVLFGCSNVFGIGLDDEYTISNQLSKLINKPVINMGVGASSMTFSLHNAIILRERHPIPLAVVNLWTTYSRTVYYNNNISCHCGSWNIENDNNNYLKEWVRSDSHAQTHAIFASKTSKLLWENTKYFECSFFNETVKLLNCKSIGIEDNDQPYQDLARDLAHPGIKTCYDTAVMLAEELKL